MIISEIRDFSQGMSAGVVTGNQFTYTHPQGTLASDLDVEKIYHSLSTNPELERNTMSVAEKLIAQGRVEGISQGRSEGRSEGLWIGKIQAFEEFLEKPQTSREFLEAMPLAELEVLHQKLHREYELHFKRS